MAAWPCSTSPSRRTPAAAPDDRPRRSPGRGDEGRVFAAPTLRRRVGARLRLHLHSQASRQARDSRRPPGRPGSARGSLELKGDEPDPIRVVLHPAGRITGRLVNEDGRPRSGVELELSHTLKSHESSSQASRSDPIFTGGDGRSPDSRTSCRECNTTCMPTRRTSRTRSVRARRVFAQELSGPSSPARSRTDQG